MEVLARGPLTIDEICRAVFHRVDARARGTVRVNLHRLDRRGLLVKHPAALATFEIKRPNGS